MKFYDDDGTEINPETVPKPTLCTTCANEEEFCIINRFDQKDEDEFICGAYVSIFAKKRIFKKQQEF